jgi:predicted alpha/beta-hydrolase family hydrolase
MYHSVELSIVGHQDEPVPHTFYRQDGEAEHLAMILPGLGYTCDMPLLYYPTELLLSLGADVVLVEYDYRQPWKDDSLSLEEKLAHLYKDVSAAARAALAHREYATFTVVGKSLGTVAITHLLESELALKPQACIYLTPLLTNEQKESETIRACPRKLLVIGTADRYYNPDLLAEVVEATQSEVLLIEGADHSLEYPGDAVRSVQALETVVRKIHEFLS